MCGMHLVRLLGLQCSLEVMVCGVHLVWLLGLQCSLEVIVCGVHLVWLLGLQCSLDRGDSVWNAFGEAVRTPVFS